MKNITFIIVAIILIVIAVVVNAPIKFGSKDAVKVADFPMVIGDWQGKDIELSERDYQFLETKNLIIREYKNAKGESVYLYIIYSEVNRRALHPPEICYTGGGATIFDKTVVPITNSIKANKFIIQSKEMYDLVVYWFKSANLSTYSYLKQQLKVVSDLLLRKKTSSVLIRVSTNIRDNSQEAALSLIKSFCQQIEPLLAKYVP